MCQTQTKKDCGCGGRNSDSNMGPTPAEGGRVEAGFDGATHGGGKLENVPGFNVEKAMAVGIGSMELTPFPEGAASFPDAALAHYEGSVEARESVCGSDDRVKVQVTTAPPWRMNAQLFITAQDGSRYVGTGWFISPRTVVTAGHCVYSSKSGGWARSIEVVPGMNGHLRPFGSAVSTVFKSTEDWTQRGAVADDYGCIILPETDRLGDKVGWYGFASWGDDKLRNSLINVAGYPADKGLGTQWYNAGRLTDLTQERIFYLIDTYGGVSGSSVVHTDHDTGARHVVGIHNYGGCDNKATRITDEVFDLLLEWKVLGA